MYFEIRKIMYIQAIFLNYNRIIYHETSANLYANYVKKDLKKPLQTPLLGDSLKQIIIL